LWAAVLWWWCDIERIERNRNEVETVL